MFLIWNDRMLQIVLYMCVFLSMFFMIYLNNCFYGDLCFFFIFIKFVNDFLKILENFRENHKGQFKAK